MAYAVIKDGIVKVHRVLPKTYHSEISNVLGGFDKLPDSELEKHGFYPIDDSTEFDEDLERRGELYFDVGEKVFKYTIIEAPNLPTLEEAKEQTIYRLEILKKEHLEGTDHIVLECLELEKDIPTEVVKQRHSIRKQYSDLKDTINKITTLKDILSFKETITI